MPTTHTSNADAYVLSTDTFRTQTKDVDLTIYGLKPLTKHDVYVDGIEYNWASRQFGKNIGDDIITDERGTLRINVYMEIPYEGSIAYENILHNTTQNELINSQTETRARNYTTYNRIVEVIGAGSYAKFYKTIRMLISPAHLNRAEHHGH